MKVTVFVSYSVGEAVLNSLSAGTIVELVREPENKEDPNAVKVLLNGDKLGYLSNSGKTIIPGTYPAAKISKNLEKPNVAGAVAKLLTPKEYENDDRATRWEAEVFWVPVWETRKGESEPIILTVGGSRVANQQLPFVQRNIANYGPGKLTLKMGENEQHNTVPIVWVTEMLGNSRNDGIAGWVTNAPPELVNYININGSVTAEAVNKDGNNGYTISVTFERAEMDDYYPDMEKVIRRCALQANELKERVQYLINQAVPTQIVHELLNQIVPNDTGMCVIRPEHLYVQTADTSYLTRTLGYYLSHQNIRLVGEKGAGKNLLVYTVCWLMNQPVYRIQGNSELDKIDLIGGMMLDEKGTRFELSGFMKTLMDGGDVVLDEINGVKPEVALVLQSLTDDAKSIDVPGFGHVKIHPHAHIWATMNEGYVGTSMVNSATADRFVPLIVGDLTNFSTVLRARVPDVTDEQLTICTTLYDKIKKAVNEGKCTEDAITTRGYIAALEAAKLLTLRTALLDNVANRSQDVNDREVVRDYIRSAVPA